MFKGILASKRVASSDFTMVTPLLDTNGKENLPGVGAPFFVAQKSTRSALTANKAQMQVQEKKKRAEVKKEKDGKDQDFEGLGMNQQFDKLLVRKPLSMIPYRNLTYPVTFRMICKYLTLCGPNLLEWMLPSKRPCSNLHK
jgi:hypothetical protein